MSILPFFLRKLIAHLFYHGEIEILKQRASRLGVAFHNMDKERNYLRKQQKQIAVELDRIQASRYRYSKDVLSEISKLAKTVKAYEGQDNIYQEEDLPY